MGDEAALLWLVVAAAVMGRDTRVAVAAILALGLRLVPGSALPDLLERHGIDLGLTLLSLAVLTPIATGRIAPVDSLQRLLSLQGALAVTGGILASWICARGLGLLKVQPGIVLGLVVGSLLGASFFGGIPIGPLFAAGVTALLLKLAGRG